MNMQPKKDTILIVDDEPELVEMLKERLEDNGYMVVTANDGNQASLKIKNQKFDLIITDINMPKKDGIKFAQEVIGHDDMPILLMSGEAGNYETRLKSLKNVLLLPKPFKLTIIPALVQKLIAQARTKKAV